MNAKIIDLPKIEDPRGNLTFIEENNHIPFDIKRVYWIYDVPGGEVRGGHAYKKNKEFIIALSGSFDVIIDDGKKRKKFYRLTDLISDYTFLPVSGRLSKVFRLDQSALLWHPLNTWLLIIYVIMNSLKNLKV